MYLFKFGDRSSYESGDTVINICYMNISGKSELNASIRHIAQIYSIRYAISTVFEISYMNCFNRNREKIFSAHFKPSIDFRS